MEKRAAAKQDKAVRSAKAGLKKTKSDKVTKFVRTSPDITPAMTIKTRSAPAYLTRIPKFGWNFS